MTRNTAIWLHGLFAAIIGGGSSAVTNAFTVSLIAPDKFYLSGFSGAMHVIELMVLTFAVNGFFTAFFYLKSSPLPAGDWDGTDRRGGADAATAGK